MISLTGKIDVLNGGGSIDNDDVSFGLVRNPSNISSLSLPINRKVEYKSPFFLGASKLGSDGVLLGERQEFFANIMGDTGIYKNFVFSLESNTIKSLTLVFDIKNNRYPKKIVVRSTYGGLTDTTAISTEYTDNDPIYILTLPQGKNRHDITISDWSEPQFPLLISGIYSGVSIDINKRNLLSLSFGTKKKDGNALPTYGLISSGFGNLTIKDADGEIYDLASQKLLGDNISCEFYLEDTRHKTKSTISVRKASGWQYDINSKTASCKLGDEIERLQDIEIAEIPVFETKESPTLWDLFDVLKQKAELEGFTVSISQEAERVLRETVSPYAKINSGSLWSAFTKICQLCGFYMYTDFDKERQLSVLKVVSEGEVN